MKNRLMRPTPWRHTRLRALMAAVSGALPPGSSSPASVGGDVVLRVFQRKGEHVVAQGLAVAVEHR